MSTLNTKKVDDAYQYDPFAEYHHPQEAEQKLEQNNIEQVGPQTLQQSKEQLLKNIDDMFDGADFVFDIANKFFKRLGGKQC